jgi:hypothetical protein
MILSDAHSKSDLSQAEEALISLALRERQAEPAPIGDCQQHDERGQDHHGEAVRGKVASLSRVVPGDPRS